MPTLEINGVPLFVREAGAGPTVLLIHGTGCDADFWGAAVERLAADCRVITYDRRGYSRSAGRPTGHHDLHADDAAGIVRSLCDGPVTVLGWSTGGIVALCLASREPTLVRSLVLQEPPLYAKKEMAWDILKEIVPVVLLGKLGMKRRAAERFNRFTYGAGGTGYDDFPEAWRRATRENAASICREIDEGTGERVLDPERVRSIRQPALGLLGALSLPYYRRAMQRIHALMPQLRIHEIPDGNHAMHLDNAAAWVDAIVGEAAGPAPA
jgi:pimeloyl-ACP methyl ester carboxylesterase